jgi:transposase
VGGLEGVDAVGPLLLLGVALFNGSNSWGEEHGAEQQCMGTCLWERVYGLKRTVVEGVRFDDTADAIVVSVRPNARVRCRCGRCSRRSPGYDQGAGRRRWRGLDAATTKVFIEADTERAQCRTHGPTVAQVPWARHDVGHTRDFDAMAEWLAVRTSKGAPCQLLRVAWRTIGSIVTRVNDDVEAVVDRRDGLRRIGIDEISYNVDIAT